MVVDGEKKDQGFGETALPDLVERNGELLCQVGEYEGFVVYRGVWLGEVPDGLGEVLSLGGEMFFPFIGEGVPPPKEVVSLVPGECHWVVGGLG